MPLTSQGSAAIRPPPRDDERQRQNLATIWVIQWGSPHYTLTAASRFPQRTEARQPIPSARLGASNQVRRLQIWAAAGLITKSAPTDMRADPKPVLPVPKSQHI